MGAARLGRFVRVGVADRAALDYGVTSAIAITVPLLVAALTGHPARGALMALGAFLVASSAFEGPYGVRARFLVAAVAVLGAGVLIGGLTSGQRWMAVIVVPIVVAVGAALPRVGTILALATLLAAVRPLAVPLLGVVALEMAGGVWLALLFRIPWPHRRLRPFLVAATGTAEAMAALIEAVPGAAAEWDDRRRDATIALGAARAARGLYAAGDAAERPRVARLVDALTALLHEIVALRTLTEALREHEPERELRPMIAALSARVRLLARTIESAGRVPLAERGSVVPRWTTERLGEIRRAALAGEKEDLVSVALTVQMLGTVDRLAGTAESAADLVAAGLGSAMTVPRLPAVRRPAALWRAVRADVVTRSPRLRRVTRTGAATAVAMAIWMPLRAPHGYWLPVTVVLCMRHTYGETASRVAQRVAGAAAGSVLGAVLLALAPGKVALVAAMFCIALTAFALRSVSHAVWVTFVTPLIMMLVDYSAHVDWKLAGERIGLTAAGGLLALAAARWFWPSSGDRAVLRDRLPALVEAHGDLIRAVAARLGGCGEPLAARFATARKSIDEAGESLQRMAQEPAPPAEQIARLQEAMAAAQRIKDDLITVADLSGTRPADAGPVPAILDQVADFLAAAAADLRAGRPATGIELDLAERLAGLDGFLCGLVRRRRAEVAAGGNLEETTPLRRMLEQAAAVRYALRALRVDAEELCRALS